MPPIAPKHKYAIPSFGLQQLSTSLPTMPQGKRIKITDEFGVSFRIKFWRTSIAIYPLLVLSERSEDIYKIL